MDPQDPHRRDMQPPIYFVRACHRPGCGAGLGKTPGDGGGAGESPATARDQSEDMLIL